MAKDEEKLTGTMQENIISLLAHSDEGGKLVAALVTPQIFEGEYRMIAERCLDFWQRHNEAPKSHTADLFDDILDNPSDRRGKLYRRILRQMQELVETVNIVYVLDRASAFIRVQRMKSAILESAEKLQTQSSENALVGVEEIWNDLLRTRAVTFEPGVTLSDFERALKYLQTKDGEFTFGVKPLDDNYIFPARKEVAFMLAPAKRGKTWFLHHVGKFALMNRQKVLHVSLEMYEDECLLRYYQSIFGAGRHGGRETTIRTFERDEKGRVLSIQEENTLLPWTLTNEFAAGTNVEYGVRELGLRAERMRIKHFPTKTLTIRQLDAFLDNLEAVEGFIPDMLLLDYIGITHTDAKNQRISLGRNMEDFRAMCDRRNIAGVTAGQLSRAGAEAFVADSTQVAEDWSMIGTADLVLVYSSTEAERSLGLGRMRVANARHAKDSFNILLSQNYQAGQFCLDAARMPNDYQDMLKDAGEAAGVAVGLNMADEDDDDD